MRKRFASEGQRFPKGPYGRALLALAKGGMRKQVGETPREFLRRSVEWAPELEGCLGTLTTLHEGRTYGRRPVPPEGVRAARDALNEIVRIAMARRAAQRAERRAGRGPKSKVAPA